MAGTKVLKFCTATRLPRQQRMLFLTIATAGESISDAFGCTLTVHAGGIAAALPASGLSKGSGTAAHGVQRMQGALCGAVRALLTKVRTELIRKVSAKLIS
ncbi:hypothetical protein NPIL_670551 [Nephila pilipes]|uniref:Uncharacterized protein n=1 Tax=Nephila pilipes TaxID=299642 RepID=A0A8X6US70_NEPPI|nr:hypothetical protein NPIL_670551 [Nephila pilipes]